MALMMGGGITDRMRKLIGFYWTTTTLWSKGKAMYRTTQQRMSYTVRVDGTDSLYPDIHRWLLSLLPPNKQRALILQTGDSNMAVPESVDSDGSRSRSKPPPIKLLFHGEDQQEVLLDGHRIKVLVHSERGWERRMEYSVTFTCSGVAARDALVDHLAKLAVERASGGRKPRLNLATRWGDWVPRDDLASRPVESVVLRAGQMERLVADLELFRSRENDYVRLGVPYHRGYLFHGPPGTGKTSIARALATTLGMDLYLLQLNDIESDTNLTQLVARVPAGAVLLIEDVDTFNVARDREDADEHKSGSSMIDPGTSLSGLLNALDGMATPHGLVTMMTTNRLHLLDDALVRKFRVNVTEPIGFLDEDQLHRLLDYFLVPMLKPLGAQLVPLLVPLHPAAKLSPADVLAVIMANLDNPEHAWDEVAELCCREAGDEDL